MKMLVTGGAGFIGSHLSEELLNRGHEVFILDNMSTGRAGNLAHIKDHPRLRTVEGNVQDADCLEPLVQKCECIFHLAAAVGVRLVLQKMVETIMTNVKGTEVILELSQKYNRKILITSTSEIYGKNKYGALHENDDRIMGSVIKQRWAYANTKTLDEFLALSYHREKGLPVVIARIFNTVGPRQTAQYGMVVPNFVESALNEEPITIFGSGRQTRCFAHVGDVVKGLINLMEHPGAVGDVFNIGNGQEISMEELANRVKELTGSRSPIRKISYEEAYGDGFEDMERRVPDLTKICDLIGYRPEYQLDDILNSVINFYRANSSSG